MLKRKYNMQKKRKYLNNMRKNKFSRIFKVKNSLSESEKTIELKERERETERELKDREVKIKREI